MIPSDEDEGDEDEEVNEAFIKKMIQKSHGGKPEPAEEDDEEDDDDEDG